jgi:small-conductance mechanosensitive channel
MDDEAAETAQQSETEIDIACGNQGALCEAILEWTGNEALAETLSWLLSTPIQIALIVAVALVANRLVRRLINRSMSDLGAAAARGEGVVSTRSVERAEERASTLGSLLRSVATAVIFGVAAIMAIEALGVNVVPLIASAGILGIAIGFGAQSIVEDFLRGVFMLAEDQFAVGDHIDVGEVNGTVERVTMRTAVIRDADGMLWHVPNSEIARVANENQLTARAAVEIGVSYQADLGEAMTVLDRAAAAAVDDPEWRDLVTRAPEVQGVTGLGEDAVSVRVVVWVTADARRPLERHLRLKLKEALDEARIEMPNRQVDVWLRGREVAA